MISVPNYNTEVEAHSCILTLVLFLSCLTASAASSSQGDHSRHDAAAEKSPPDPLQTTPTDPTKVPEPQPSHHDEKEVDRKPIDDQVSRQALCVLFAFLTLLARCYTC